MNQVKSIILVDLIKTEDLGLKIIFAEHKITKESYAVIIEVNPFGIGSKENVEVGDILLSFNGMDIESYATLEKLANCKSENNEICHQIQLKIQKRGSFDISGLYAACLNSPCSEICKIIKEWKPKVIPRKKFENKIDDLKKTPDLPLPVKKLSSAGLDESMKFYSGIGADSVKYKLLQKALPMKTKENKNKSYKAILKPKKSFQSHIISPPQPLFIKRKNIPNNDNLPLTNLKESKSLTNLSISNDNYLKNRYSSSSVSSDSSDNSVSKSPDIFVPKPKHPMYNIISQNQNCSIDDYKSLENSKRLSKSIDLVVGDTKDYKGTQTLKWKQEYSFEKAIYKPRVVKQRSRDVI